MSEFSVADGVKYSICIRESVDPEDFCIDHLPDENSCKLCEMSVDIVVGGEHPLLDGEFELIYIWDILALGYSVDTNI